MTLPASGAISFNNINVELGLSGTTQASLGQASYRTLAGVASGAISMSNFYGKANQFAFTISSNQTNANLRTLAVNAGWNQSTKVVATIGSGIYCSSNSTGTPGLTINGSFPGGVELINNGFIIGRGGTGGTGGSRTPGGGLIPGSAGAAGGLALSVSTAVTINNAGTIGGGGGGGGGGGTAGPEYFSGKPYQQGRVILGGGGGGGGRSGVAANGTAGTKPADVIVIIAGPAKTFTAGGSSTAGTSSAAGSGGSSGNGSPGYTTFPGSSGAGGNGGNWGASGSSGASGSGQGAAGGFGGGGGGAAISGNSNITYIATGTRLGAIS